MPSRTQPRALHRFAANYQTPPSPAAVAGVSYGWRRMKRLTPFALQSLEARRMMAAAVSTTDVLADFAAKDGLAAVAAYLKANPKSPLAKSVDVKHSKHLFKNGNESLVELRLNKGVSAASTVALMKKVPTAIWASPNYVYGKQPGEASPNDPKWPSQADALKQINLPQAWDVTVGSPNVVVAVIDDGFDATNADLKNVVWTNPGEIPGNGIDDDGNGYVDDVHGYDFGNSDNDPSPAYDPAYGLTDSHGTQVAEVLAASADDGVGIAGVAAGVKIMPVRFRGAGVTVTSADIAQAVAYAANNGAKIINLSYSFDPYMNDPAFYAAVDLAYAKGVLWVNSAGNNNVANPPRTTVDKILFVDNVDNTDSKAADSNYGTATDISAPGVNVPAVAPGDQYYPVSGTSFSSAVTSGIAALIWSAHPTWTRDQVAAQLLGTATNIDAKNTAYAGLLGTGRVDAYAAVSAKLAAPTVRGLVGIAAGRTLSKSPATLSLGTLSVLDTKTVTAGSFELRGSGVDGQFETADDTVIPLSVASPYAYGSNTIALTVGRTLADGNYRFTAKTTITDPFGTALAAPYVTTFTIAPLPPAAPTNFKAVTPNYSQTEAELSWTDASDNQTGFVIERSSSPTFATIDKTYAASANSDRYNDWGLSQGSTYYYRVRAVNAQGSSTNSTSATLAVALPPAGIPAAPGGLSAVAATSVSEAVLKWADNSSNETGFVVQRSTSAAFATIDKSFTAVAGSNQYWDWGLSAGTTYYYRVRAVNGGDASDWSNTAAFTTGG